MKAKYQQCYMYISYQKEHVGHIGTYSKTYILSMISTITVEIHSKVNVYTMVCEKNTSGTFCKVVLNVDNHLAHYFVGL
jgi:hypothetical protein